MHTTKDSAFVLVTAIRFSMRIRFPLLPGKSKLYVETKGRADIPNTKEDDSFPCVPCIPWL